MRLLLDTHIVLWAITNDERLTQKAAEWIANGENEVFYSLLSVWEIAIKHNKKPDKLPLTDDEFVAYAEQTGLQCLTLNKKHISALKTLQRKEGTGEHHDPFDRLLICQAKTENMLLLTHDHLLSYYGEPCVLTV